MEGCIIPTLLGVFASIFKNDSRHGYLGSRIDEERSEIAKCDTWCELQNPVNHRVFERKLRRGPLGQGTPAWASRIVALPLSHCVGELVQMLPPFRFGAVGPNDGPRQ
ncbi:TPA_asm: hypothetical protein HUJ06_031853 [Nelumbo nucifera]|uniref:Uncharacterized protein n=1 Tax=Nelumbo nucifera TaxID=4432 RepID=A0A822ZWV0_NELNU|nr:TPA_asm: hypothetical protein HUJ06_031853 [Nelumbo nucifera]